MAPDGRRAATVLTTHRPALILTDMGWVTEALQELTAGRPAQIRPQGGSMRGRIESGDLVTLTPVDPHDVKVDDVVLVRWKGNYLLHLVRGIRDGRFLIGNNIGRTNGWADAADIRGKVTAVVHDAGGG